MWLEKSREKKSVAVYATIPTQHWYVFQQQITHLCWLNSHSGSLCLTGQDLLKLEAVALLDLPLVSNCNLTERHLELRGAGFLNSLVLSL